MEFSDSISLMKRTYPEPSPKGRYDPLYSLPDSFTRPLRTRPSYPQHMPNGALRHLPNRAPRTPPGPGSRINASPAGHDGKKKLYDRDQYGYAVTYLFRRQINDDIDFDVGPAKDGEAGQRIDKIEEKTRNLFCPRQTGMEGVMDDDLDEKLQTSSASTILATQSPKFVQRYWAIALLSPWRDTPCLLRHDVRNRTCSIPLRRAPCPAGSVQHPAASPTAVGHAFAIFEPSATIPESRCPIQYLDKNPTNRQQSYLLTDFSPANKITKKARRTPSVLSEDNGVGPWRPSMPEDNSFFWNSFPYPNFYGEKRKGL